jgi:lipoate-protein ligase B
MPAVVDWALRDYASSLDAMRTMAKARRRGEVPDTLILVEHPPVVTVGREGDDGGAALSGLPVVPVERGGRATYHGPGQLVGYPIVDLDPRGRDVRRFVHDVESLVVDAVGEFGVRASHRSGQHGVWVDGERKIASIGIAVDHWVTLHGFAVNVDLDLTPFEQFHPCGLRGTVMTSVAREIGRPVSTGDLRPPVVRAWERRFGAPEPSDVAVPLVRPPPSVRSPA